MTIDSVYGRSVLSVYTGSILVYVGEKLLIRTFQWNKACTGYEVTMYKWKGLVDS